MVANIINEVLFGYLYTVDDCDGLVKFVEQFDDVRALQSNWQL